MRIKTFVLITCLSSWALTGCEQQQQKIANDPVQEDSFVQQAPEPIAPPAAAPVQPAPKPIKKAKPVVKAKAAPVKEKVTQFRKLRRAKKR